MTQLTDEYQAPKVFDVTLPIFSAKRKPVNKVIIPSVVNVISQLHEKCLIFYMISHILEKVPVNLQKKETTMKISRDWDWVDIYRLRRENN